MKFKREETILVSACLMGINCKWNGENNLQEKLLELTKTCHVILVCPEQLGGLATPRNPAEVVTRNPIRIMDQEGKDVTLSYVKGSGEVLKLVKLFSIKKAILKAKSPSCGNQEIYDGTFTKSLIPGEGVTTKLLKEHGVEVMNEMEYLDFISQNKIEWESDIYADA